MAVIALVEVLRHSFGKLSKDQVFKSISLLHLFSLLRSLIGLENLFFLLKCDTILLTFVSWSLAFSRPLNSHRRLVRLTSLLIGRCGWVTAVDSLLVFVDGQSVEQLPWLIFPLGILTVNFSLIMWFGSTLNYEKILLDQHHVAFTRTVFWTYRNNYDSNKRTGSSNFPRV